MFKSKMLETSETDRLIKTWKYLSKSQMLEL